MSETERVEQICELCERIGLPDLREKVLAIPGLSLDVAKAVLFDAKCSKHPQIEAFKKEYADNMEYFKHHGTTEQDYVRSRMIDAASG